MSKLRFNIRTKDHSHPLTSGVARTAGDPDVSIELLNSRNAPGISTSELLMNIAIGVGTGVPAGIAANWLFVKLGLGRDTRLYDQTGELIATVKQLEQKLEELLRSSLSE